MVERLLSVCVKCWLRTGEVLDSIPRTAKRKSEQICVSELNFKLLFVSGWFGYEQFNLTMLSFFSFLLFFHIWKEIAWKLPAETGR